MKIIREFYEGNTKVTEYEISTEPHCVTGTHTTGQDGTHCKHCGINVLACLDEISEKNRQTGHFADLKPRKKKGTLDDFIIE